MVEVGLGVYFRRPSGKQHFPVDVRCVPRPDEINNPSSEFWDYDCSSSQFGMPETPKGGINVGTKQGAKPPQAAAFKAMEQQLHLEAPSRCPSTSPHL